MVHRTASCREKCVSFDEFLKAAQHLSDEQRDNGKDFLQLVQTGGRDVVFVTEGHHKQQSVALNIQLPTTERAEFCDLAPPPHPHWRPTVNVLHPAAQLSRELHGNSRRCNFLCGCMQPQQATQEGLEGIPFGVTERCKLLTIDFITKQPKEQPQQSQEELNPFMQHPLQEHEQRHPVLSVKVTLQRMSAGPGACTEQDRERCNQEQQDEEQQQQDDALQQQQRCNRSSSPIRQRFQCFCNSCRRISSTNSYSMVAYNGQQCCEQAYACVLEYPLFQLQSSDYIVPADIFDRGLQQWSIISNRDKFTMLWDDTPYMGHALKFRQRPSDDRFHASPWRSIEVEWEDHAVDRENDPEDWCYGNPWEMIRTKPLAPSMLLLSTVSASKVAAVAAGFAPWTEAGAAAVEAAAKKRKKHRRPKVEEVSDDFTAFDGDLFYYDDDPEDYKDEELHSRRKRHRQHQQRGQRDAGNSSRLAVSSAVTFSNQPGVAAVADGGDDAEPKHSFGREMMGASVGVCLVCRNKGGQLVTGHSSRASQNCSRVYHVGCLLLLNALGIRSTMQTKQQQQQQQQEAPDAAAVAAVQTDGSLQQLRQQQQSDPHLLGPAVAAAVDEAAAAAVLHQDKQIGVCCPAHYCHGCGLNGKHEYMVWCCCCLLRVYHWRNCIPLGAEVVKLNDKDYIRCPACVAAGVPPPGTAAAAGAVANVAAEIGPSAAVQGVLQGSRRRRGRQLQQQDREQLQQLALQHNCQESELPQGIEKQHSQLPKQREQQQQRPASPSGVAAEDADAGDRSDSAEHDSLVALPDTAQLVSTEADVDKAAAASTAHPTVAASTPGIAVEDPEGSLAAVAAAADVGSRRQSPAPAVPLDQLEEEYQKAVALQQHYEQQQQQYEQQQQQRNGDAADPEDLMVGHSAELQQSAPSASVADTALARARQQRPAAPAGGSVGRVTRGSLRCGNITGAGSSSVAAAVTKTASSSAHATVAGGSSSSSALDALMPAWLRFSLEDRQRQWPSYKLVALPDSGGDCESVEASNPAAAALRHVAAAVTRLPFQAADVAGTATELSLCSPQTHWLIGSAEKAESAKYKATGSWAGCPVIQVPTPDDGVFGLCLVVDHYGLVEQQQLPQEAKGARKNASHRAAAAAAAGTAGVEASQLTAGIAGTSNARIPGVYLRCWKPVMQGSLQQQQKLLQLQQSGDERGGCAYQVLLNDKPFPEALGRQELLVRPGDCITVQGRKFKLMLTGT